MHRTTVVALGAMFASLLLVPRFATAEKWNAGVSRANATVPAIEARIPGDYRGTSPGNHLSAEISAPLKEGSLQVADFDLWVVGTYDGHSWARDTAVLRIQNTRSGYTLRYLPSEETQAGYAPGQGHELCEGPLSVTGSAMSATVRTNGGCSGTFPGTSGTWNVSFTGNAILLQNASDTRTLTFRKVS